MAESLFRGGGYRPLGAWHVWVYSEVNRGLGNPRRMGSTANGGGGEEEECDLSVYCSSHDHSNMTGPLSLVCHCLLALAEDYRSTPSITVSWVTYQTRADTKHGENATVKHHSPQRTLTEHNKVNEKVENLMTDISVFFLVFFFWFVLVSFVFFLFQKLKRLLEAHKKLLSNDEENGWVSVCPEVARPARLSAPADWLVKLIGWFWLLIFSACHIRPTCQDACPSKVQSQARHYLCTLTEIRGKRQFCWFILHKKIST